MKVNDKVSMITTHTDGSVIRYAATVRKVDGDTVWVEIPERVRRLPFPPYNGHRYAQFPISAFAGQQKAEG